MNNRTTLILSCIVIFVCAIIGIGFATSQPQQQKKPVQTVVKTLPSKNELAVLLTKESKAIWTALAVDIPEINQLYTIDREQLYDTGQWYGAILQYKGTETNNRDTLRLVMKKERGEWKLKTTPPQPLVSALDLQDAPRTMLDDINRPATLLGTENSPTINPNE